MIPGNADNKKGGRGKKKISISVKGAVMHVGGGGNQPGTERWWGEVSTINAKTEKGESFWKKIKKSGKSGARGLELGISPCCS